MSARDTCADTGRTGDGRNTQTPDRYTGPMDFRPTTLAEQNDLGGYNRVDLPVGGDVVRQTTTHGSAGMDMDMGTD